MGYLANFIVYTLAMTGVIAVALLVFKSTSSSGGKRSSKCLKVIDTLSLAPRKTLYIVSTGREKFLIAGDVDKTSLISKLETGSENLSVQETFKETMQSLTKPENKKSDYMDRKSIGIKSSLLHENAGKSVMRNLADKIKI